jgi:hypothetical protein
LYVLTKSKERIKEEKIMKLSEIEKISDIISLKKQKEEYRGKAEIQVNYKLPSIKLMDKIRQEVLNKLKDEDTDLKLIYTALPLLTDIEVDKDIKWFKEKLREQNYAAIIIYTFAFKQIQRIANHVDEMLAVKEYNFNKNYFMQN